VGSEIAVMALYPRLARRLSPLALLAAALATGALRWWLLSIATSPAGVIAQALLHGVTFGAFYLAAIGVLAREVPPHLRASGQALFMSTTFGLGGLIGNLLAGRGYDLLGGARLFQVAAVLEIAAALLVLGARQKVNPV
jgi:PPP family 3-phenylpropionic acid transporter